jgi:glycosyltransferase involved in cell wall biosynthesis
MGDGCRDAVYFPFFKRWDRWQHRRPQAWIAHTEALAGKISRHVSSSYVTFIPHPIPQTAAQWAYNKRQFVDLVTPGFIKAHKGYDKLLNVVRQTPSLNWLIAGGPQTGNDRRYLARLNKDIRHYGLQNRVTISGYLSREQMEDHLMGARLAIFPFQRVTGSGSISWAAGLGMPVLTTDLAPLRRRVEDGMGIRLLPQNSPQQWPRMITSILQDRQGLTALAERNRAYADRHRFNDLGQEIAIIINRLIATRQGLKSKHACLTDHNG